MANGGTSSSQTSQAPPWQQGYQQLGLNQALSQYQNMPQLVAPFAPQQEQAITNITGMGGTGAGDPTISAAQNWATNTLNGGVQQNPELNALFKQGANQIQQQMDSQFAGAGRNVDQNQGQTAQALGNFASGLYGNAFNTEAGLQQSAAGLSPALLQGQLGLQNALFGAGQNIQNLGQAYINAPQQSLNQYLSRVNGNLGTTTSTPYNPFTGALGGGLLGGQVGNSIGGAINGTGSSNWGSIIGSLLGGYAGA